MSQPRFLSSNPRRNGTLSETFCVFYLFEAYLAYEAKSFAVYVNVSQVHAEELCFFQCMSWRRV